MAKKLILYCVPLTLLGILLVIFLPFSANPVAIQAAYSELQPTELVNSVTVKGTVESVNKHNIYTSLGFRTKEIQVKIGDHVEEGQVLCVLDTEDLALSIEQYKAELNVSQRNSLNEYDRNQMLYNDASASLSDNQNAKVLSAANALQTAKTNLESAQRTYDELYQDSSDNASLQVETTRLALENAQRNYDSALNDYNNSTDANIIAAEGAEVSAKLNLTSRETEYKNNKILYENGVISLDAYTQSENLYQDAVNKHNDAEANLNTAKVSQTKTLNQLKNALATAQSNYDSAVTSQGRSLEQAKNSLDAAKTAYQNAQASYNSASSSAEQDINMYKANLDSAEIALNNDSMLINLKRLEKQMADSTIKSPAAGTVTAIYAVEGSVAGGLLFVVEDIEDLQVKSAVKEYDYSKIAAGMEVIIKSDSTGDTEFQGVISSVDPTAKKNALGETMTGSDVEFGITVSITSKGTPLMIGTNARLDLVLDKKEDIFRVRYDAVAVNDKGQNYVFAAQSAGSNTYTLKRIVVDVGMSTDFYLEISNADLKNGMKVMNDAAAVTAAIKKINKSPDNISGIKFRFV